MLMCIPQVLQVAIACSIIARPLVPGAVVLVRVLQALQVAFACSSIARHLVPGAPMLVRVPQALQVAAVCREKARIQLPRQSGVLHGAKARSRRECEARARELVEYGEEHFSKDVGGKGPEEGTEPVAAVSGRK